MREKYVINKYWQGANLIANKKMISKTLTDADMNHEEFTLISIKAENYLRLKE